MRLCLAILQYWLLSLAWHEIVFLFFVCDGKKIMLVLVLSLSCLILSSSAAFVIHAILLHFNMIFLPFLCLSKLIILYFSYVFIMYCVLSLMRSVDM